MSEKAKEILVYEKCEKKKKKKKERGIDTLHLEITLTVPLSVFSSITLTGSAYM